MTRNEILEKISAVSTERLKNFSQKLIPGTKILGANVPKVRDIAKEYASQCDNCDFEYEYFEETIFSGFIICFSKADIKDRLEKLKDFIPHIKNWAECDSVVSAFKFGKKESDTVWNFVKEYFYKAGEFEKRFAVIMALSHFCDEKHIDEILEIAQNIKSGQFYTDMGLGWLLSVCFIKFKSRTQEALKSGRISKKVLGITLSKIRQSKRTSEDEKKYAEVLINSGGK